MNINVYKVHPEAKIPNYETRKAACFDTNLYNVPSGTTTIIKSLYAANISGSTNGTVSVSVGATGATAAFLIRNGSVPITTTLQLITEPVVLEANDRINAQASGVNLIDLTLSYMEIT